MLELNFLPHWPFAVSVQTAFGTLLLVGAVGGYLAHRVRWLPSVTGFMLVGLLIGPSGLGMIDKEGLDLARTMIDIALGLILYRLGLTLDLRALRTNKWLLPTALIESAATFGAAFFVLRALDVSPMISALASAIVISSSPAVLMHVAHEVGADGPVTERAKELVALNNVISFFVFSAMLPVGHLANAADWGTTWLQPIYQLAGSTLLGIVLAYGLFHLAKLTRKSPQYRLALIIGAVLLGLGLSDSLNVSTLFVPLVAGVVIRTLEHEDSISAVEFGEAFELFFIVLFVYAGAKINLRQMDNTVLYAIALVLARGVAKSLAIFALAMLQKQTPRMAVATGALLMPMAGLAIGLMQTADSLFAIQAEQLGILILSTVVILETLGPPVTAWGFRFAGEAKRNGS